MSHAAQVGADTVFTEPNGETVTLTGVQLSSFIANDLLIYLHVFTLNDFNGDLRGDVVWRHDSGLTGDWLATGGGMAADPTLTGVTTGRHIVGSDELSHILRAFHG